MTTFHPMTKKYRLLCPMSNVFFPRSTVWQSILFFVRDFSLVHLFILLTLQFVFSHLILFLSLFLFFLFSFWLQHFGGISCAFSQSRENNRCDTFKAFGYHMSLCWHWLVGSNHCCTARCDSRSYCRWFKSVPLQSWLVGSYIYNE